MHGREQNVSGQQSVLIIADAGDFARDILARWQMERQLPAFTLVTSEMGPGSQISNYDLVIVGPVEEGLPRLLQKLGTFSVPALCVIAAGASSRTLASDYPGITVLRDSEGWVENLVLLANEMLRRVSDQARLRQAEKTAATYQKQAALGHYMQEMRHSFNNALTSVLGNAELVLLKESTLDPEVREQVGTIRDMALNLHEMMQRFTSLELELQCGTKEPKPELAAKVRAVAAGFDA